MHIYGIQKDGTNKPVHGAAMEMKTENRFIHKCRGEEGGRDKHRG